MIFDMNMLLLFTGILFSETLFLIVVINQTVWSK